MKHLFSFFAVITLLGAQSLLAQWIQTNGPYDDNVRCFAVSDSNLFAGTQYYGVYRSTNNGTSWIRVNNGLKRLDVQALAVSGSNVFAGTYGDGVFLSTNNGASWTATGLTNTDVRSLAVNGSNLFAGTYGDGVFFSTNNGTSWIQVNNGLTNSNIRSFAVSGSNLFAGSEYWGTVYAGVFVSINNGANWTAVGYVLPSTNIRTLAVSGSNLFVGTDGGVFVSTNNGIIPSWKEVNTGLTNRNVQAIAVNGSNLFAGTNGGGVFVSTDNGENWVHVGLTNRSVWSLAVCGSNLFAGTYRGGVWRRPLSEMITGVDKLGTINVQTANIRSAPSLNSAVITKANLGDSLRIISVLNEWLLVEYKNEEGYISAKLVKDYENLSTYQETTAAQKVITSRSKATTLSITNVKTMLQTKGFHDSRWNKSGAGSLHQYVNLTKVVLDKATGLMWQLSGTNAIIKYDQAKEYIIALNNQRFADYDDWRLPTLEEAISLMEPKKNASDLCISQVFDRMQLWIWTADRSIAGKVWIVNFSSCLCDDFEVIDHAYVRAVRSAQTNK